MSSITAGEPASVNNEENLSKTFETTAETLFGSITDNIDVNYDNNQKSSSSIEINSNRENIVNHKDENKENPSENIENVDENIGNTRENIENAEENKENPSENIENVDENIGNTRENIENADENKVNAEENKENTEENKENTEENKESVEASKEDADKNKENTEDSNENKEDSKICDANKSDENVDKKCNFTNDHKTKSESDTSKKMKSINSLAQQILDGKKDPLSVEFDDTLPILTYITHYRNEKMASHEVNEAERSDAIIATIIHNYRSTLRNINRTKKEEFIKDKLQKAEKKLQQAEKQTKLSITELKAQNDQSLRELKAIQNREVDDLINKFNSPVIQRHYTQASPQLRTLRFQMQLLQQSKRFDELRITQKRVETEEKIEIEKVSRSMASQLQSQMKLLEEKHRGEIESRQIAFEDRETKMRRKCNQKTDAIKNHINNINADLQMLQSKQTESSQNIMQNGELMLKITKATAIKKSRPSTSMQKKKAIKKNDRFFEREGEMKPLSRSLGATDIFSLKLPQLIKSKGVKEKREKLLEGYKA